MQICDCNSNRLAIARMQLLVIKSANVLSVQPHLIWRGCYARIVQGSQKCHGVREVFVKEGCGQVQSQRNEAVDAHCTCNAGLEVAHHGFPETWHYALHKQRAGQIAVV